MSADDDIEPVGFPAEEGWLELPPPDVSAAFVDRTMARLLAAELVRRRFPATDPSAQSSPAADPTADPRTAAEPPQDLPQDLLAQFSVPPVSARFLDDTLTLVQRDRVSYWRSLLLRYESPTPSAEFVDRTLAALAAGSAAPAGRIVPGWLARGTTLAAAAAALLVWLLWLRDPGDALGSVLTASPPTLAYSQSPALLSHLLAVPMATTAGAGSVPLARSPLAIGATGNQHAPADPAWLWLTSGAGQ